MKLAGNVVNHVKADPERDMENRHTFNASFCAASPHCMMNLLMRSTVETSPCLENLVKSESLYFWGNDS